MSRRVIATKGTSLLSVNYDDVLEAVLAQAAEAMRSDSTKITRAWIAALENRDIDVEVLPAREADRVPRSLDWWASSGEDLPPTVELTVPHQSAIRAHAQLQTYRKTLRVGSRDSESFVIHVAPISDVLNRRSAFRGVQAGRGIVPQEMLRLRDSNLIVSLRELVNGTLADDLAKLDRDVSRKSLDARIGLLRTVLEGLESLHAMRLLHGNLHPENIDRTGQVLDYLVRPPIDRLTPSQRVYLAPEVFEGRTVPASDVYAFGKLAQRLLGAYLWDSRKLPNGLNSDAFEWLMDYCTVQDPESRPSVRVLMEILEGGSVDLAARATRSIRSGAQEVLDVFSEIPTVHDGPGAVAEAADHIGRLLIEYPETTVAVSSTARARNLLWRIALDDYVTVPHNTWRRLTRETAAATMETFEDNKTGIDTQWRDRVHRQFFGVGIPLDPDLRADSVPRLTKPAVAREYRLQLEKLGAARENLLSKDSYLYSSGVAERLSVFDEPATPADVAVLRRWGHILAVPDHGRWLYPSFQFDERDNVPVEIELANTTLRDSGPWEVLSFWHIPRPSLDGATFASTLHSDDGKKSVRQALARLADPTRASGAADA